MDQVKEAFQRVKKDMDLLQEEIHLLKLNFKDIQYELQRLNDLLIRKLVENKPLLNPAQQGLTSTYRPVNPTDNSVIKGLKDQNKPFSIGNEGVPTDKQTNRQTDKQTNFHIDSIDNAVEILNSLDGIKREIRLKFKRLTDQEFLVFSTLYQLEEEGVSLDYKTLSSKLNLTESSIRDYIGRLIKKGIPVEKTKINNKTIKLAISENLKKIVTFPTILHLRDL